MAKLSEIQKKLKAPKGQYNNFGKYKYRSCEDILEAVKPLLGESSLQISDDIVQIGERYYIKATVSLVGKDGDVVASASAFAREPEHKKGMDESQITGTASSYARKYALNGLFCIDDTKDADSMDNNEHSATKKPVKSELTLGRIQSEPATKFLRSCANAKEAKAKILDQWNQTYGPEVQEYLENFQEYGATDANSHDAAA